MKTDLEISSDETITMTHMNHIVEVQHMEHMNTKIKIRKLDKYLLSPETGFESRLLNVVS